MRSQIIIESLSIAMPMYCAAQNVVQYRVSDEQLNSVPALGILTLVVKVCGSSQLKLQLLIVIQTFCTESVWLASQILIKENQKDGETGLSTKFKPQI